MATYFVILETEGDAPPRMYGGARVPSDCLQASEQRRKAAGLGLALHRRYGQDENHYVASGRGASLLSAFIDDPIVREARSQTQDNGHPAEELIVSLHEGTLASQSVADIVSYLEAKWDRLRSGRGPRLPPEEQEFLPKPNDLMEYITTCASEDDH